MARNKRVRRSKEDLVNELHEQVALIIHACQSFDNGLQPVSKHIALSLRVLLHHHGQSRALLEQLKLRDKHFLDTAGDLNPRNLLPENKLCIMRMGGGIDQYLPHCAVGAGSLVDRQLRFERWWNNNVIKDDQGRFFNRRELILNVADTDGGAHVDSELDEAYMDLSRNNSLGWIITNGEIERPFPPPIMACIRQIAHEVLETLKVKANGLVEIVYEPIHTD